MVASDGVSEVRQPFYGSPLSVSLNSLALTCALSSMQLLNTAWAYFTDRAIGLNRSENSRSSSAL